MIAAREKDEEALSVSEEVEVKQECAAHHEAGNIVIAAVDGVT
jgi:hypothetical protein